MEVERIGDPARGSGVRAELLDHQPPSEGGLGSPGAREALGTAV